MRGHRAPDTGGRVGLPPSPKAAERAAETTASAQLAPNFKAKISFLRSLGTWENMHEGKRKQGEKMGKLMRIFFFFWSNFQHGQCSLSSKGEWGPNHVVKRGVYEEHPDFQLAVASDESPSCGVSCRRDRGDAPFFMAIILKTRGSKRSLSTGWFGKDRTEICVLREKV